MSHSADVCLYVLALHRGLLPESELDARVAAAVEAKVSLKARLFDAADVDQAELMRLLEAREEYARRCEGCRVTSYVLPGQEETCRHCQGPLFRRRHTPPPAQREQLARMVEERLSSGRVAQLNAVPEETPPPTRSIGVALASNDTLRRGALATKPAPAAPAAIPSPWEEMKQNAVLSLQDLARRGLLPRLAIAAVAVVLVAGLWSMFAGMLEGIEWHISDPASVNHARAEQRLRVVVINDPSRKDCMRFTQEVLTDSAVVDVAKDYVWQMDNAKSRIEPPNRSNDYAAAHLGTNQLPFVLIYSPNNEILTGKLGAGGMTPDEFLALLAEAEQKLAAPAAAE